MLFSWTVTHVSGNLWASLLLTFKHVSGKPGPLCSWPLNMCQVSLGLFLIIMKKERKLPRGTEVCCVLCCTCDSCQAPLALKRGWFYFIQTKKRLIYFIQTKKRFCFVLLIAFIWRYSPLLSRLTALACDSTWVNSLGVFCVHPTTMHSVTSCKATYLWCILV